MADEWDSVAEPAGKSYATSTKYAAKITGDDDSWGTNGNSNNAEWSSGGGGHSNGGSRNRDENGGGGYQRRDGDWTCDCGGSNYANRTECFKCKEPKPENANTTGSSGGGERQKRPGDWNCSCGVSNFASRTSCFKCSEEKPEGAGADTDIGFRDEKQKEFYIPPETDENEIFNSCISSGINFEKYDHIPVKVTGERIPKPCASFADANLEEYLINNINRCKYTKPTPIQKYAVPIILNGRDLMGCAQTGSGKTAAFLLPIINTLLKDNRNMGIGRPHVVIMSPTRELAIQIYDEARKFASGSFLKTCVVYGGTATRHQSSNISKGCHILVATPGRLKDFVDKTYITFDDVRFIVLDEADRMLDLGFMPAVEELMRNPTMVPVGQRQTLMFSATFPEDIQRLAGKFLKEYIFITVGIVGGACADVEQNIYETTKFEKRNKLAEIIMAGDATGTMVFTETKRDADFLASFLSETKIPTTSIHGDRIQRQREEALRDFKTGRMKILVATSVAARGLDIPNVRHVINYNLPKGIDDYVHRIGRTGRVGNRGKATSFFEPNEDQPLAADLVRILKQAKQPVPEFLTNAGGGSGGYDKKGFGGRDVRNSNVPEAHGADEDEDWA